MSVKIDRVGDKFIGSFIDRDGRTVAKSDFPMGKDELVSFLETNGAHTIDVFDELARVAPDLVLTSTTLKQTVEQLRSKLSDIDSYPDKD